MLSEKLYVQPNSELWREIFQPVVDHVHAATVWEEEYLRVLALRRVINHTPPTYAPEIEAVQRLILGNYHVFLSSIKYERQQSLEHAKRLKARGIKPGDIWKYPYRSKARKKKEQEWETYCKSCVLLSEPINYSQR